MADGVQESMLDCFTLKPVKLSHISISGHVKHCTKDYIFIAILSTQHLELLKNEQQTYDIIFHVNRQTYQLQHYALECLVKNKLFDSFLKNPKYDCNSAGNVNEWFKPEDYSFRYGVNSLKNFW